MRKLFIITLFAAATQLSFAQWSQTYSSEDADYTEGISLYQQGHYAAAQNRLKNYQDDFYYLACAFELRQQQATKMLPEFLKDHPYTTYASEIHFMQGVLWVESNKYKKAVREFGNVKENELFRPHQNEYYFYRGYAHVQMNEPKLAASYMSKVKDTDSPYALQAKYYYAYSQYSIGNYGKALPDFLAIEDTKQYANIVPYYTTQIYYAQGQYDQVVSRAETLLKNNPGNDNNAELYRILGEISYQQTDYAGCVSNLKEYESLVKSRTGHKMLGEDIYLLGISQYKQGNYEDAANYLQKVSSKADSINQSAQLHLGHSYRLLGQLEKAKVAYLAARNYKYSAEMCEEAAYNYALTTYQSSSAFGDNINAFNEFLDTYPNSSHKEQIYALLSDMYMASKDYKKALESLNQISNPTAQMQLTKQYFRYKLGTNEFVNKQYEAAITWFTELINNSTDSKLSGQADANTYLCESWFWKAESEYRLKKFWESQQSLSSFLKQPGATSSSNYVLAKYLEGYIYFQQKDYSTAQKAFAKFVEKADQSQSTYADALNRLGDCAYTQRDFVAAEAYYTKVIALGANTVGVDYAMFQRGYTLGLLRRYADKVNQLDKLASTYKTSSYADDALYEIARAEIQRDRNTEAIAAYDRLLNTYPSSSLASKAALEKAMLYYNQKDINSAITAYKAVIKNYPNTSAATSALEGLENCYVETNRIDEYLAYRSSLGSAYATSASSTDSVSFAAAERQYMQGNYADAAKGMKTYLNNFCDGGRYCVQAQYYIADSYYRTGEKIGALAEYKKLAAITGNPYMEEAVTRVAEITYDQEDYQTSLQYFQRLLRMATTQETISMARLGVLRCSYYLGDNSTTVTIATTILDDAQADTDTKQEARYNRAKAYAAAFNWQAALGDFQKLTSDVRTAIGAESEYMTAQCQYELRQYDQAEATIMAFANMNTSQQYWLARAFVLLSDVYMQKGEDYQAQQFLLSLQQNYTATDDIQQMIASRLQAIDERNQEKVSDDEEE